MVSYTSIGEVVWRPRTNEEVRELRQTILCDDCVGYGVDDCCTCVDPEFGVGCCYCEAEIHKPCSMCGGEGVRLTP